MHFLSATTDATGHFEIAGIAPGQYIASSSRQGYVGWAGSNRKLVTIAPDKATEDVQLGLMPGAVVSGQVKDELGKALADVSLELLRYTYGGEQRQLTVVGEASSTNAAGQYRIAGLAPGHYYLRGTGSSIRASSKSAPKQLYAPTYYPGVGDPTHASELTVVRPGEELAGIDLVLKPVRAVNVAGRVLRAGSLLPYPEAEVDLVEEHGSASLSRHCAADAKGNFELPAVPPGEYVLVAQSEMQKNDSHVPSGRKSVHVGDSNLSKIDILISLGVEVRGHIHADAKEKIDLSRIKAVLQPEENPALHDVSPGGDHVKVSADGSFIFADVAEGTYSLNFFPLPRGYYLKDAGPVDLLDTGVMIAHDRAVPALDFNLSPGAARLEGTVLHGQQAAAAATVVLVPEGNRKAHFRYRHATTDQSGRFSMISVIPGDYKVFAFEDSEDNDYLNPEFLQPFEPRGESVHLEDRGYLKVRLDVISATESSP